MIILLLFDKIVLKYYIYINWGSRMSDIKELIAEIEALRKVLVDSFESEYSDKDIIVISQRLDVLIVEYMKKKPGHP
ncbi:Spo0E like sporulation regulatory protein [Desulfoscipio gibsoniae DSM 7213]|uniref:Spo0E like sporulation regulatory protein n=2 Tax=Desulfoscipio gibsoniae TaxID=102134 RepID=R4KI23_9FIRM|nr:Spo0E like sporulation regulatory protein [Desulfoscipio gibsoniae DSM 7213]